MKVGDIVKWTLPAAFSMKAQQSPTLGVIVEMHIGNGANVAWFADDMRVTWVPLLELEIVSES
jgi:hypothetical protein